MLPLFSIFFIFFTSSLGNSFIYKFTLNSTMISFLLSLILWLNVFNQVKSGFQCTYSFFLIPSMTTAMKFGVDGISLFFVLLTNIFIYLCILTLNKDTHRIKEVLLHLLFLQ